MFAIGIVLWSVGTRTTRVGAELGLRSKTTSVLLLHSQTSNESSNTTYHMNEETENLVREWNDRWNQHTPEKILPEWNHLRAKMKETMRSAYQRDVQVLQEAEDSIREELRSCVQDLRTALLNQTASGMPNEDQKIRARQSINEHIMQVQKQIKKDLRVLCQSQQDTLHNSTLAAEDGFAEMDTFIESMAMQKGPYAPYSNLSELRSWMSDNMPQQQYRQLEQIMNVMGLLASPSFKPDLKKIQRNQNETIHQPLETFRRDMNDQLQDLQDSMEFQVRSYLLVDIVI